MQKIKNWENGLKYLLSYFDIVMSEITMKKIQLINLFLAHLVPTSNNTFLARAITCIKKTQLKDKQHLLHTFKHQNLIESMKKKCRTPE